MPMKLQSYKNFWQRIHKSAKDKGFPLRVMCELTYRCNFYCKHCYVPQNYRKYGELKTEEVFSILDQLKDIGCFYLGFTGGEPFIREDMIKILWYAKKLGFEIIIYTNGSLIDKEIANELSQLRPNKVDITIPGMSKTVFENISGVSGSRDKVFKAIELLHKKGVNLGFKTCVLKENEDEIEDIKKFAESLGALHRLDNMLMPRLDGSREPFKYRGTLKNMSHASHHTLHTTRYTLQVTRPMSHVSCPTLQVTGKGMVKCGLENCDIENVDCELSTESLFKCGVGQTQAAITPLGELKMCLMIDYPKYKLHTTRHTLKEAWEKLKDLVKNIKPDENYKCGSCELKDFCKWCPAKAWLYNGTFTSCDPESRAFAEARRQALSKVR